MCLASGCVSILHPRCRHVSMLVELRAGDAHFGGYPCCAEETGVLVHVEGHTADGVRLEHARAQVMDEAERRQNERSCSG